MRSYRDLLVWQRALQMAESAYMFAALLPRDERFGLVSQIQRAAVSVSANIAEGHERRSTREYLRFMAIAFGSLAELETLVELSLRLYRLSDTNADGVLALADETGRMLRAIETTIRSRIEEPGALASL